MIKYEKGTLGYYREIAKKNGFDKISDYFNWKNKKISKNPSINKKLIREYQLWRWKIKRILIEEKIIENSYNWKTTLNIFDSIIIDILENNIKRYEIVDLLFKKRSQLVEHHTKYKEIHGIDKSIWMVRDEHKDLHLRLREEGKCNVPSEKLEKISKLAQCRTDRHRKRNINYHLTYRGKELHDARMAKIKNNWLIFWTKLAPNVRLQEQFVYYDKTGTLTVSSGFVCDKRSGTYMPVIKLD